MRQRKMKQITIRELRRSASATSLQEWMPCEIVVDGEPVAMLVAMDYDVRQAKASSPRVDTMSDKPSEGCISIEELMSRPKYNYSAGWK